MSEQRVAIQTGSSATTIRFSEWGAQCRARYVPGSVGGSRPRGRGCPDCGIDDWITEETPDAEEWSALHYCACCGFLSIEWRP